MKDVRSITTTTNALYAATTGGMFVYDFSTSAIQKFTNTDGLASNNLQTIYYDSLGSLWLGATNGAISVYTTTTQQWKSILDIKHIEPTRWQQRTIRGFVRRDSLLFIAADFGVTVFRLPKWEFGDTYTDFGFPSSPTITTCAIHRNTLWVGTTGGIAYAPLSATNLISPSAWVRPSFSGLSNLSITSIVAFHDTVLISTPSGIAVFHNGMFHALTHFSGISVQQLLVNSDILYILQRTGSATKVFKLKWIFDTPELIAETPHLGTSLMVTRNRLFIGTSSGILQRLETGEWINLFPNGPASNAFTSLVVDNNGVLWAASRSTYGAGFYRFNPDLPDSIQWKNFTSEHYPLLRRNNALFDDYYTISLGSNNTVWVSSWGNGVIEVRSDTLVRRLDYFSKPSLLGAVNQTPPSYVVTGGVAVDSYGKTWIANRVEWSNRSLLRLDTDTSATYFDHEISMGYVQALFHGLWIDQYNTKWLANSVPTDMKQTGLFFLNEEKKISGTTPTGWGRLTTANGLPSDVILCVTGDLDGAIWIGTSAGAVILYNPLTPSRLSIPYLLKGRVIQCIAVDGVNHKWIGTKEGLLVTNPDGTELLAQYSTATTNGVLPTDDVRALAIDSKRGIVYIGTEEGLTSLSIPAIAPLDEYTSLRFSPQPFIPAVHTRLVISNLVTNTTIKIFTSSGILVKKFEAQGGGRAFWDGTNEFGNTVPSGVYLVVAYSPNANPTVGKVAVLR
ncbi:MAG: hypothetical protein N3A63_09490 [Bacteroidetes bacterium]|nr:hypothetical protein [Bacteroidota bacterium]